MGHINVRVAESLKRVLEAEARERGVRPSDIVREVLEQHARERSPRPNPLELAKRLGIIGCVKGLPADLSTNPEHMEGFGPDFERILIDTGPMVAIFSEADQHHEFCLADLSSPLFPCWPVITEAAWLLRKRPDSLARLFASFQGGFLALLPLEALDLIAFAALRKRYEDAGLQLADTALAHLAERENIRTVFTTDHRDFSIIRLKRKRAIRLIPDVQ